MELKTKYEYTYFIYPYVIKESKYLKYLMKLLKDKNCELRIFKKDKDMDIYSFFSHRTREYMFGTFNYSKNKKKTTCANTSFIKKRKIFFKLFWFKAVNFSVFSSKILLAKFSNCSFASS